VVVVVQEATDGTGGPNDGAHVVAVGPYGPYPGCNYNDTASAFWPRFGYVNLGNRAANNTIANLTYRAPSGGFVAYLDLPLGDIPAYASGYVELDSIWVQWGRDVCPREHEFRVSMRWDA